MRCTFKWGALLALLVGLSFSYALADTITNLSPSWVIVPGSIGPNTGIFGLPANTATCGNENELTCEQTGVFVDSSPFVLSSNFFVTMTDSDSGTAGNISDYVLVSNNGPGGNGMIQFFSDPNLSPDTTGFSNQGVLCVEDDPSNNLGGNGCFGTINVTTASGAKLTINPASDSEAVFDPFGFGFDTSDQIKFSGAGISVPEPSGLLLLGTGLLGLGAVSRRLFRR